MIVVSLFVIAAKRKDFAVYGINFNNPKYHINIAGRCFIPFILAGIPLGMGVDHTSWGGAILLAGIQIALLFVIGSLLRGEPSGVSPGMLGGWILLTAAQMEVSGALVYKAIATFVTYAIFVGFGEEIIYRGYMQSRLNEAFGRPYRFLGVQFGWGLVIASLLFGLSHVGLLSWLLGKPSPMMWAWSLWTFFSGLVFGWVREKSESIVAPALLHGLPQAIASAVLLFL